MIRPAAPPVVRERARARERARKRERELIRTDTSMTWGPEGE